MQGIFKRALLSGTPIEMIYLSKKQIITQRIVTIKKVDQDRVLGICHQSNQIRMFNLENILSVTARPDEEKRYG
ncbi:MAG: hypothetical protein LPK26_01870 [Bacillaceae bacterium]|uniref:WYL domain-containing protein n=1 Tax=Alkalihalobacterium chitinilyticum TaxID=2980103 RepID=A0ABT5VDU4_9BACI|nr:hypothetical protein [Alkalihalobacterium chitinilyticum]MDE5413629.1 hypothetical protein [Alkalihalobacterium chitinilyticum]MEB1806043.1 hypothetical protein [Bacillaceae bacterium]